MASLFLKPLPKPMSIWSSQIKRLLTVSHTPFWYAPRQFSVRGTISNTTIADHPFATKDARTFFINKSDLSLFFMNMFI